MEADVQGRIDKLNKDLEGLQPGDPERLKIQERIQNWEEELIRLRRGSALPKGPGSNHGSPPNQRPGSDKGSGGKYEPPTFSAGTSKSCALGAQHVTVADKFPEVTRFYSIANALNMYSVSSLPGAMLALSPMKLSDDVLQFCMKRLFAPVVRHAPLMNFGTEAALVQLIRAVMQEACLLCNITDEPLLGEPLSMTAELEEAEGGSSSGYKLGAGPWSLGYEMYMHVKGALKGRIELQFMQKTGEASLFKGALEVGIRLEGPALQEKFEQAEKECICMWLHNAARQHYDPVFVILFDGTNVCRLEFAGLNTPMQTSNPLYAKGMPCRQLRGSFKCTVGAKLWESLPDCETTSTTLAAVALLLGALGGPTLDLHTLEAKVKEADDAAARKLDELVQAAVKKEGVEPAPKRTRV